MKLLQNSITFFRKSIAMAIIDRDEFELGKELLVQVRKRQLKAKIVKKNQIEK